MQLYFYFLSFYRTPLITVQFILMSLTCQNSRFIIMVIVVVVVIIIIIIIIIIACEKIAYINIDCS